MGHTPNWPVQALEQIRSANHLPEPSQVEQTLQLALEAATVHVQQLASTEIQDEDSTQYTSLDDVNLFTFTKDSKLIFEPTGEAGRISNPPTLIIEKYGSEKAQQLYAKTAQCNIFSTTSATSITRAYHVVSFFNRIEYFANDVREKIRTLFIAKLMKAGRLQTKPFEHILFEINQKKLQKPGKKVFVIMYGDYCKYLRQVYVNQKKIIKEINGAKIIAADDIYFGYGTNWRAIAGESNPPEYSAAIISEDEITWNFTSEFVYAAKKVPRRVEMAFAINFKPCIEIAE